MSALPTSTTTTSSAVDAARALSARGVAHHVVVGLTERHSPDLILTWCGYAEQHASMGAGALINAIRRGEQPPSVARSALDEQAAYDAEIVAWLRAKLPDVCRQDPALVAWVRQLDGDVDADRLAASASPHPAAVAAVIRLHHRIGRGRLTVGEHGAEIRAAVKASNAEAIADYERIAAKRAESAGTEPPRRSRGGRRRALCPTKEARTA